MVKAWLAVIGIFLATAASAVTSSSPFTAVNTDGRPMTGATVTITNDMGLPVASVWADPEGTVPYSKVVPSTGIVQFFAEPGAYVVTIAGSGVTRQFYIDIPTTGEGGLTEDSFGTGDGLLWKRGGSFFTTVKVELSSTRAPTVNDDGTKGFIPGSIWVDVIHDKIYMNTGETAGASQWHEVTNSDSGGGLGNIANGTNNFQVPFWASTQWVPGSGLWTNGTASAVGPLGIGDSTVNFQVNKSNAGPVTLLWNSSSDILSGTELGSIEFGAPDSGPGIRRGARIVARAINTWGPNTPNNAPTSLDFRAQFNTPTNFLSTNALRVFAARVAAGPGVPDQWAAEATESFATTGIDIFDGAGNHFVALKSPAGLTSDLGWIFPTNNGTSGQALVTDGGSPDAHLMWANVAPGLHASTHAQGGTDEVASYQKIYDESTLLPQRRELVFTGAGVTCSDAAGKTSCSIASGAGGGITSLSGDTSATQTLVTGTSGVDFNIQHNLSGTHTFNIPDASELGRGFVNTTAQRILGVKTFTSGLIDDGPAVFNGTGNATADFQVKTDNQNFAIFADADADSVGIMTNTPNALAGPTSLAVLAQTGKSAITALGFGGKNTIVSYSGGSNAAAIAGFAGIDPSIAILGSATSAGGQAGFFTRTVAGTKPVVDISQDSGVDTQPLLRLTGGEGKYQVSGRNFSFDSQATWGINPSGKFESNWQGEELEPMFSSTIDTGPGDIADTGFFVSVTNHPGISVRGKAALWAEEIAGFRPRTVILGQTVSIAEALPANTDYVVNVGHAGDGNGIFVDNTNGLGGSYGIYVKGGTESGIAKAGRFDSRIGTALEARQTGAYAGGLGSTNGPIFQVIRDVTLTNNQALSGPLILGVDASNTTGRLIDLQRPATNSLFFVENTGQTTIDSSLSNRAIPGLIVRGPHLSGVTAAVIDTTTSTVLSVRQTGVTTSTAGYEPAFNIIKNTNFSAGGISSGELILGEDDTANGIGDLIDLQKFGDTYFKVNYQGELGWLGVSLDGTGKVLCVKSTGDIGTCSTTVNASGVCTCG